MTTIAMKSEPNGKVKIAWDTMSSSGSVAVSKDRTKVIEVNGQFAVGVAGQVRYSNLIQHTEVPLIETWKLAGVFDPEKWVIQTLVPTWMHEVKSAWGHTPHGEDGEVPWGVVLVALDGRIFRVGHDFSVVDAGEFTAIGTGSDFAIAAMHLGKTPKQAVDVARDLDIYSGGRTEEMTRG